MLKYKRFYILVVISFVLLFLVPVVFAESSSHPYPIYNDPKYLIENVIKDVIYTIRTDRERYENNDEEVYKLVKRKIMPHVDVHKMSKIVLGRYWRRMTIEQQTEFMYLFETITTRSYAVYILEYKDSYSLHFNRTIYQNNRASAVVHMILKLEQNREVDTRFALYQSPVSIEEGRWKIFNLSIEGINFGMVYRSTYSSVIRQSGIPGLLDKMRQKLP
jgi:phospholipid transport system substrate-binding protein